MHPHNPPAARLQRSQIACRLGCNYHAKGIFLTWNRHVYRMVRRDLQKDTGIGATLVVLPSGVQKTWAEFQAGSHPLSIAYLLTEALYDRFVLRKHVQESQRGKVVARVNLAQMCAQIPCKCGSRGRRGFTD